VPVLELGDQPLANALRAPEELDRPEPRFPLDLAMCPSCSLVQILDSIPPEFLFEDYPYFSSVIAALVEHARVLATGMREREELGPDSLVVELASNDGYLLQHYRDAGVPVLGIEPARNIARVAEERGIPTLPEFFGRELGERLAAEGIRPDVMHANNVLAHVPDLNGFVAGVAALLRGGGVAVIEAPYVKDLLDDCEFDTIYHEHLCYFSLTAIDRLFRLHDLTVERVERIPIHGGSLRVFARRTEHARPDSTVAALLAEEDDWSVDLPDAYLAFADEVRAMGEKLREMLAGFKRDGKRVAAYGAAAKGSTLLNTFGLGADTLDFVADASPHKQGNYMPGSALAIRPPSALVEDMPDYVLLLAWNFADEILAQQSEYRERGGRFIVPVPEPTVL
jgi:SAM-dependent methyltransferase